jgi:hypothetical protein
MISIFSFHSSLFGKISLFLFYSSLFFPPRLVAELQGQFAESAKLEAAIRANLKGLGYVG